ncbi:MAG: hypothetical protein CM15mP45_21290 [Deltaproteobacteria bacterium]|nr:MAG: hypothetical protein CM15mP45_21290 [Deltaproteobacteria bacterium]
MAWVWNFFFKGDHKTTLGMMVAFPSVLLFFGSFQIDLFTALLDPRIKLEYFLRKN